MCMNRLLSANCNLVHAVEIVPLNLFEMEKGYLGGFGGKCGLNNYSMSLGE